MKETGKRAIKLDRDIDRMKEEEKFRRKEECRKKSYPRRRR